MVYNILHTYKEEVFVPLPAITNYLDFFMDAGTKQVETRDKVICEVTDTKIVHMLSDEAKEIVQRVYNIDDVYAFMRKWYGSLGKDIFSMDFVYLKLKR